jgi:hypothetical protein
MCFFFPGFLLQMQNDCLWTKSWLFGNARWPRDLENVVVGGGLRISFIMKSHCPACEMSQNPLWCCRIQMFLCCIFCQNAWHWFIWDASLISIPSVVTHWCDALTVLIFLQFLDTASLKLCLSSGESWLFLNLSCHVYTTNFLRAVLHKPHWGLWEFLLLLAMFH